MVITLRKIEKEKLERFSDLLVFFLLFLLFFILECFYSFCCCCLVFETGSHCVCYPGLPGTCGLPASTSQVLGFIGVYHLVQCYCNFQFPDYYKSEYLFTHCESFGFLISE